MQTGIQILAAFLVVLPFQTRFQLLTRGEENVYFVLLAASALLIVLLLVPVAIHRHFFGQRLKPEIVRVGHHIVKSVGMCAGLLVAGCVWFVVHVLRGWQTSLLVGGSLMVVTIFLLIVMPYLIKPSWVAGTDYRDQAADDSEST